MSVAFVLVENKHISLFIKGSKTTIPNISFKANEIQHRWISHRRSFELAFRSKTSGGSPWVLRFVMPKESHMADYVLVDLPNLTMTMNCEPSVFDSFLVQFPPPPNANNLLD